MVWASAVAPEVINTTGAGDAFLAGFLSQVVSPEASAAGRESGTLPKLSAQAALTRGCSWGALAVSLPTTLISSFGDAPEAQLRQVDRDYVLMEKATVRY